MTASITPTIPTHGRSVLLTRRVAHPKQLAAATNRRGDGDQWTTRTTVRNAGDHLLTGLLFDDAGHRMAPTHATKAGIRYRYYVSLPCLHGEAKTAKVGSITRVPAADVEEVVVKSLNEHLRSQSGMPASGTTGHSAIAEVIDRIDVYKDRLAIRLRAQDNPGTMNLTQ